jgi:predicted DNA-binding transcriptional regulator AlpA
MAGRVFLDQADLKKRGIPYSNVHLRRLEARGLFPKRIVLGTGRSVAWDEQEIDEWQNKRLAERSQKRDQAGNSAGAA